MDVLFTGAGTACGRARLALLFLAGLLAGAAKRDGSGNLGPSPPVRLSGAVTTVLVSDAEDPNRSPVFGRRRAFLRTAASTGRAWRWWRTATGAFSSSIFSRMAAAKEAIVITGSARGWARSTGKPCSAKKSSNGSDNPVRSSPDSPKNPQTSPMLPNGSSAKKAKGSAVERTSGAGAEVVG